MLKFIELTNFRSHKHSLLEFCKGINVIIGKSLSGKTNIIRSLLVVKDNRPLGFKYHSKFAGEAPTEIKVGLFDDTTPAVTFRKTTRNASYEVGDELFKGIRANVPDRVSETLNLSDINIQKQLDKQFLICSSPGETAKAINRITRMEQIDTWTSSIASKLNAANRDLEQLTQQKGLLEEELKTYTGIEQIGPVIEKAEEIEERVAYIETMISEVTRLKQGILTSDAAIARNREVLRKNRLITLCLQLIDKVDDKTWKELAELTDKLISVDEQLCLAELNRAMNQEKLRKLLEEDLKGKCPICFSDLKGKNDVLITLFE